LKQLYHSEECEPRERQRWLKSYHRLLDDATARLPLGCTREDLHQAILLRVRQKKAALQRQPPTLPPKA